MESFWFWRKWNKEYRVIWSGLAFLFLATLAFMWYGYLKGPEAMVHWEKVQNQKTIESVSKTFEVGNFEFSVPIESYATLEYFTGSDLQPNTTASYIFVIILTLAAIILLTVTTTFSKFWYFVVTGLFTLFIVSLRLDVLELFGARSQLATIIAVVCYVGVSFYFSAFHTTASFTIRLISFSLMTAILATLIYFFSDVEYPFLHLSVAAYLPGMILSVIFIIMIAHEILASFVYLTSQGTATSKSLRHFLIISVIYIVNLAFTYMHEVGLIQWNFIFINLYLLLTISALLSIWGFKKREPLHENIVSFNPFGAYFIAGLAVITFATTAMFLGTGNDAALKVIRHIIIFSHLGFGGIFLLYFFSNFIVMMAENLNVYKVLYTPTRMPYATYRIAGLIATLAFVFYSQWQEYVYTGMAGIFNSMGDLQLVMEKPSSSEAYYRQARIYSVTNYHSNYMLAGMESANGDFEKAHFLYSVINSRKPTEFSLINDGNLYIQENNLFYAAESYGAALKKEPASGIIKNNLAYAYIKLHMTDSAYLLLEDARKNKISKQSAEINLVGLFAVNNIPIRADSLATSFNAPSDATMSNAILIASQQKQPFEISVNPLDNPTLDLYSATLLNNYLVYKLEEIDTTFISQAYRIASDSVNSDYSEALKATLAHAYYYQNNVAKALEIMGENAYITQTLQGKFNYTMGLWALNQGNATLAVKCFAYAVEQDYKDAKTYNAIALAEAHMPEAAMAEAVTLLESKNASDREIGKQLKNVYSLSHAEVLSKSDLEKYQYCRYRLGLNDSVKFNQVITTYENSNYKALTILEMAQRQFEAGSIRSAIRYYSRLEGITFTDKALNDKIKHFELELLASRREVRLLASRINEGRIAFTQSTALHKMLYSALISEVNGDSVAAKKNYEVLGTYNPFFEEGVIAAARYFKDHSTDRLKAYSILTEAKHINTGSARLIMAYITEATRVGFDDFAADAYEELEALQKK